MKYGLFRAAAAATRMVPRSVAFAVATGLARAYFALKRREAVEVAGNLRRIAAFRGQPLDAAEALRRARSIYISFAKTVADYFYFGSADRGDALAALVEVENIESLARARAAGKGTVVITAHLGSVENGGATIVRHGYKFNVVALQMSDPRLDELFQAQRTGRGMQVVEVGRATRECLRVIQRNEIIALLGDRDFTRNRDATLFFGAPARLPTGPARLALGTGATIVLGFCVRLPDDRYKLFFYDPIFTDKAKDTVETLNRRIAEHLERAIGEHAEQWHLFHSPWDIERDWTLAQAYAARKP
ncbi:MAG: lysophospholipid acyltransferase family protein [Verrucomicrobia bacterium]|nr:lysophospholipid acyltransferase family protein [Verrucomicrobiota bacterium]